MRDAWPKVIKIKIIGEQDEVVTEVVVGAEFEARGANRDATKVTNTGTSEHSAEINALSAT